MPGDEVIIPDPTYTSYREAIRLAGCEPIYAPLDESNGWSFDINSLAKLITSKTKAIFYCNPNNPTGTVYTKEQLLQLAELAQQNNLFIISDEVYKDFIYDDLPYFSLGQVLRYRKIFIRIFSFSKAYAMTGWRVGYVHSDASVIKEIMKVHDCLVTCAPVVSQYAAMGALEMGAEWLNYFKQEYAKRRDLICSYLDKLSDHLSYTRPNSAYFVMPKYKGEKTSFATAVDILDQVKLAVVPGSAFGPAGEYHLRLSFGRKEEDITEGLNRLEQYFILRS
jgi:aspartate/methionine/tyrosine aminotransferase